MHTGTCVMSRRGSTTTSSLTADGVAGMDHDDRREAAIAHLARLIADSKHCIFCTGAGISTNFPASLRDYRGPNGIWTEAVEKGLVQGEPGEKGRPVDCPWDEAMYHLMPAARPTLTHRAITELCASGLVKHVVSQNEDGLHRRSGLPSAKLSELHGNAFIELCGRYTSDHSDSDDSSSSSSSSSDSDDAELSAACRAAEAEAKKRRPPGCGAAIVRRWVTYYPDTYKLSNTYGRHVTGRRCPECGGGRRGGDASDGEASGPSTLRPRLPARAADVVGTAAPLPRRSARAARRQPLPQPPAGLKGSGWLLDSTVDFGESPDGHPWGRNPVHNLVAARHHMRRTDLVVVWGSSLGILANYFDPWHPQSKWAKPPPSGVRLGPASHAANTTGAARTSSGCPEAAVPATSGSSASKRRRGGKSSGAGAPAVAACKLVIINQGPALDEELAALKISDDVDTVAQRLLQHLGLPSPPPEYDPQLDPLFDLAVPAHAGEPVGVPGL